VQRGSRSLPSPWSRRPNSHVRPSCVSSHCGRPQAHVPRTHCPLPFIHRATVMCEEHAWGPWRVCGVRQATWSRPSLGSQECTGCIARKPQPPPSWAHPRTCNRARASPYTSRCCSTQGSASERAWGCTKRPPTHGRHPGIQTAQVVLGHQLGTFHTHPRLGCHAHTFVVHVVRTTASHAHVAARW
jgi:hypothetical protein